MGRSLTLKQEHARQRRVMKARHKAKKNTGIVRRLVVDTPHVSVGPGNTLQYDKPKIGLKHIYGKVKQWLGSIRRRTH